MNTSRPDPVKALVLMSGGLDSRLAACVLRAQGIAVTGISFESPFFTAAKARQAAEQLGLPLIVEDYTDTLLSIVEHPRHGFGSCMNPCIDCHTAMIRRAGERMERDGFHLIATGEVVNQRPMSQTPRSLGIVAAECGYGDWLLRPLSAKLLPLTEPERRGWVDRERLLALNGRSRKPQEALAVEYGIRGYPPAAGGCSLTEPNYAIRLKDLRDHGQLRDLKAIALLKVGRHFRVTPTLKLIVGRDAADNERLEALAGPDDVLFRMEEVPGPSALLTGQITDEDIPKAAAFCARYSDGRAASRVAVQVKDASGERALEVTPATEADTEPFRIKTR